VSTKRRRHHQGWTAVPTLLFLLGLLAVGSASASTYLVLPDGSGDAPTISSALALAVHGDVIELGDGVFSGPGNRNLDLAGLRVTLRSRSGNPRACVIDPEASAADPARALLCVSGETASTLIQGIGFRGGHLAGAEEAGAAVLCVGSAPHFDGCRFRGNFAVWSGGALAALGGADPLITNSEFSGNSSTYGGAVVIMDAAARLDGCIVNGNWASERGGGIYAGDHADLSLDGSTLVWNASPSGGGVAVVFQSSAQVSGSIIAFSTMGEGIGLPWSSSVVTLSCSDIHGNADGDWVGDLVDQLGVSGNIDADPLFCGAQDEDDLTLRLGSPCSEAQSGCGLIGALPVDCDAVRGSIVRSAASWSTIKSYY